MKKVLWTLRDAIAVLTLNREEVKNAFDDELIEEATKRLASLPGKVRVLLFQGKGTHFSAGADLAWMERMAHRGFEENKQDAEKLWNLLETLLTLPVVTLARIQGGAFGGALGLIAACDIAIAEEKAQFAFSEVRLGLVPAVVSPFVALKCSPAFMREVFLTGRPFSAQEALAGGLVQQVVPSDALDEAIEKTLKQVLKTGPEAIKACKALLNRLAYPWKEMRAYTTTLLAKLRESQEGRQGMEAFLKKEKPPWVL